MTIVGFNFTKMLAEKSSSPKGKINITNNITIKKVEKTDLNLGDNAQLPLKFTFEFTSKYEPKVGIIEFLGDIIYLTKKENAEAILEEWKKDKRVGKSIMTGILNNILSKCNIQALILSRDMNMPPPVPMMKVEDTANQGK